MVKILTASYSNKLVNIHDSANPTSLFPHLFLLGPADRFLAVLCVCRGLFGNRLVASLLTEQLLKVQDTKELNNPEKVSSTWIKHLYELVD